MEILQANPWLPRKPGKGRQYDRRVLGPSGGGLHRPEIAIPGRPQSL